MQRTVMRHLVDEREPITTTDIDQAIRDGAEMLEAFSEHGASAVDPAEAENVLRRLHVIVLDAYGCEAANDDYAVV